MSENPHTDGSTNSRPGSFIAAWVLGMVVLIAIGAVSLNFLHETRQVARRASCANDLKQLWLFLSAYASEHLGSFPPYSATRGNLMMDPEGLYPDIMLSSCWVQCEYSEERRSGDEDERDLGPSAFNDGTLCYLPWEIADEKEGMAFVKAYKSLDLSQRENDLQVTIDGEKRTLPSLRNRTKSVPNSDSSPRRPTPIVVEWPHSRHADMCVLYSDGSVNMMKIGDGFPMTESFIAGLREIATLDGPLPSD